jgi:hypothetical protein
MDQDEYQDYLVDKAKELLDEQTSDVEEEDLDVEKDRDKDIIDKAEEEGKSKIPAAFDPREIEHLANNRKKMDNQELKQFLEKESDLQKEMEDIDEWKGFSRWEERFMIQNNLNREPDEIAEELGREEKEVRLKMRMLGLDVEFQ